MALHLAVLIDWQICKSEAYAGPLGALGRCCAVGAELGAPAGGPAEAQYV
jgi:hypothetical protein